MVSPRSGAGRRKVAAPARPTVGGVRTQPTQQGVVYLWTIAIFSGVLWWQGENLVFLLGTLALGAGAVAWRLARRNVRDIEVTRDLPPRTQVGVPTTISWQIQRRARGGVGGGAVEAIGIELEDRPARGIRPHCLQLDIPVVPAAEPVRCETQVSFGRRGVQNLGTQALELSSRFPLGLFLSEVPYHLRGSILVRPREGRPTAALRDLLRGRAHADEQQLKLWQGDDVIYGVREYREGDDPRRIHWRTTARRGTAVISEWRSEHGDETVVVLGLSQGAGHPAAAAFERAVSATATIWRDCARQGLRASLILGKGRPIRLGPSGRGLDAGLDALAHVKARGKRAPRRVLKRWAEKPASRRTIVYVGTGSERGLESEIKSAAGRGGSALALRADLRSILRWVRGIEK